MANAVKQAEYVISSRHMQVCGPLLLLEQLSMTLCLIVRLAKRPYFYILSDVN